MIGAPRNVTRDDVLRAIALCDLLGEARFLEQHGYRPSLRYLVRHNGRSYPSKAVLGVASGLRAADFFGGAAHTVRELRRLGFEVRDGRRVVTDASWLATARDVAAELGVEIASFRFPGSLAIQPHAYFASGSNRPPEINGCARVGQDVGVAAPEITPVCEEALARLRGTDIQVFVDSGAFSEVSFKEKGREGQCVVVKPMTDRHWDRVLSLYERLALRLGDQLHVVAPDRVGDQAVTLERLARYRLRLARIAGMGARVLVPVQKGTVSQTDFARRVAELLRPIRWVPALPCRKAATTPAELGAFVRAFKPRHVHLMGVGPNGQRTPEYLAELATAPGVTYQCDANWITSKVGRKDGIRPYTAAQDVSRVAIERMRLDLDPRELGLILAYFGSEGVRS